MALVDRVVQPHWVAMVVDGAYSSDGADARWARLPDVMEAADVRAAAAVPVLCVTDRNPMDSHCAVRSRIPAAAERHVVAVCGEFRCERHAQRFRDHWTKQAVAAAPRDVHTWLAVAHALCCAHDQQLYLDQSKLSAFFAAPPHAPPASATASKSVRCDLSD